MDKYNLRQNEAIIMTATNVCYVNTNRRIMEDELVLTNRRIIHISKSLFGRKTGEQSILLGDIQVTGNAPAVACVSQNGYRTCLQICMKNGVIHTFSLYTAQNVVDWINAIFRAITGHPSDIVYEPETGLKGFWNELKDELTGEVSGIKKRTKDDLSIGVFAENAGKNNTMRCISCRAPLSGTIGDIVICEYCDTKQTIEEK